MIFTFHTLPGLGPGFATLATLDCAFQFSFRDSIYQKSLVISFVLDRKKIYVDQTFVNESFTPTSKTVDKEVIKIKKIKSR